MQPGHHCVELVGREPVPDGLAAFAEVAGHTDRGDIVEGVRGAITTVETSLSADLPIDFALGYLTGRIAKEQVIALQSARDLVNAARARAEHHWQAAIAAERRRLALEPPTREPKRVESV